MPIFVRSSRASGGQDAVCIPLEFQRWGEYDSQVAAVGQRLDTGHEGETIAVVLSSRDRHAQNRNRRSLEEWREGFNALNQHFRLDSGGIVSFKNCRRINDQVYVATWPNVLACNPDQVHNVVQANHVVMRVMVPEQPVARVDESRRSVSRLGRASGADGRGRGGQERGAWGDVVVFFPEAAMECETEGAVARAAQQLAGLEHLQEPMFLLRALNATAEVVAATEIAPRRRRQTEEGQETYASPSPQEIARLVESYAVAVRRLSTTIKRFNLLPADRFLLSPLTMFSAQRKEATLAVSQSFREKHAADQEIYVAKEALMKLSDPSEAAAGMQYVNGIYPVHPFGRGSNPDLLGGLVYATDAVLEPVRLPEEEHARAPTSSARKSQTFMPTESTPPAASSKPGSRPLRQVPSYQPPRHNVGSPGVQGEDPFAGVPSARMKPPRTY